MAKKKEIVTEWEKLMQEVRIQAAESYALCCSLTDPAVQLRAVTEWLKGHPEGQTIYLPKFSQYKKGQPPED